MDFEALDAWLERLKPAPKVDGTSMLDGYLGRHHRRPVLNPAA